MLFIYYFSCIIFLFFLFLFFFIYFFLFVIIYALAKINDKAVMCIFWKRRIIFIIFLSYKHYFYFWPNYGPWTWSYSLSILLFLKLIMAFTGRYCFSWTWIVRHRKLNNLHLNWFLWFGLLNENQRNWAVGEDNMAS